MSTFTASSTHSSTDDLASLGCSSNRNSQQGNSIGTNPPLSSKSNSATAGATGTSSTTQTSTDSNGNIVVKKGILLKRGRGKLYHPWQLRTVVILNDHRLYYYQHDVLKGSISLEGTSVRLCLPEDIGNRENGFEICNVPKTKSTQDDTLILVAGSEMERDDWIVAIETAARNASAADKSLYTSFGDIVRQQKRHSAAIPVRKTNKKEQLKQEEDDDEDGLDDDEEWDDVFIDKLSIANLQSSPTQG